MPKYMLVIKDEDGTGTLFFDNLTAAEQSRMDAECGMGAYVEVYERTTTDDGFECYEFLYA